jgi:RHS repeat-associated protein
MCPTDASPAKQPGSPSNPKPSCEAGNPINGGSGVKRQRETDFGISTLGFTRTFASYVTWQYGDVLGRAWSSNLHSKRVTFIPGTGGAVNTAEVERGDSRHYVFTWIQSQSKWTNSGDIVDRLTEQVDGQGNPVSWNYYDAASDNTEQYNAAGQIITLTTREGLVTTFGYNGSNQLTNVTDAFGRALSFIYDGSGRVNHMTDPAGGAYDYTYDANNNLISVTYPADSQGQRKTRIYSYENASFPNALTGITDENGWRFATYAYDANGLAIQSKHQAAAGVDVNTYSFNYATLFSDTQPQAQTIVTDPLGTARTYTLTTVYGAVATTATSQPCPSCGNSNFSAFTYDGNGNLSSRTDFNNKKVCYWYDTTRNLETTRVEGMLSSETCTTTPPNRPDVRKITTTWNATYRLPATIVEPAPGGTKTTTFTYDTSGNLTQKSTVAPKNDGSGTNITRTTNWSYGTLGRVATATDPNGKITTYTYYADNDPTLGKRGQVATITNPASHVTSITAYDANGRALSITDPNGLVTALTYDSRGRLTSRTVGTETTTYAYDGVGQLTLVTLPDGSTLAYTYDGAHRLTQIADGLGNRIAYTLDAMGNRIAEQAYDPGNNLQRARSRTYDALNRLQQDLGALNQTTTYAYDNNSNLTTLTDPLNHATGNTYDALNRLTQVLDPANGITQYTYDGTNNLTQVTDPRGLATIYTYDGLNNLTKLVSPDTGTTTSTFDAAGNLLTKLDARGVTATYTYDTINRATQIVYSKSGTPSETHSFTYDSGANAKGRLTQVTDPAATTSWTYTSQGRVASKAQQVGSVGRTLSYGYNSGGQLTSITTPSGQQLGYSYANNRVTALTINGASLLSTVIVEPFGPLAAWQWSNSLFMFRDYDQDGRLATWEFRDGTSILRKDQSFDLASRITAIADPNNPAASQTYQYDVLDRLTLAQTGSPVTRTQQFTYDALGNRLNATLDSAAANLYYTPNANRLQAMVGVVNATYLNGATVLAYTYNNANRMVAVQSSGSPLASYAINALGQRVSKTVGGVTTLFVYDEQGHLLGEYDGSGNLIQETVWLEDLPVATLRPTGSGYPTPIAIYYVHADHLGSARAVTRPSDNALMWQWDNLDPFGANAANENPSGQGTFKYGLRFPGQYYDAEVGTNYNYFRDYDPAVGRYIESDPIGLAGGINTYVYVSGSPIGSSDQTGLQGIIAPPAPYPPVAPNPPIFTIPELPGSGLDGLPRSRDRDAGRPGDSCYQRYPPNLPRERAGNDPYQGYAYPAGRDECGNCLKCRDPLYWPSGRPGYGSSTGYYRWVEWNQSGDQDCCCVPRRNQGPNPPLNGRPLWQ